jgi:hypothetical protein
MDKFTSLICEWRYILVYALLFVMYALVEWKTVKSGLYAAMLQAKDKAKDKILNGGTEQENWVVENAYIYLPLRLKLFISKEALRNVVHYLYNKAKDKLDDGEFNNSVQQ